MNLPFRWAASSARWLLCVGLLWLASACSAKEDTVGVGLTGLDHLAAHLSIQNFWVNGSSGHQAGKGGSTVCCVSLPATWRPGLIVHVKWGVTNWKRRVYSYYERDVAVDRYDAPGNMYVHFLRDGEVRVLADGFYPEKPGYPGPSYDTVLKKKPWDIYARQPDEPLFDLVPNSMEDR